MPYRKAEIRPFRDGGRGGPFGLASLDRGADSRHDRRPRAGDRLRRRARRRARRLRRPQARATDAMRVDQLFVSPEHEAEGIGRQLLEWAEGYAISERAKKLEVIVEAENRRALEFYRGRGFIEAGEDLLELRLPEATS